jgi:hypothetical protein
VAVDTQFIDDVFLTCERFAVALNLEMLLSSNWSHAESQGGGAVRSAIVDARRVIDDEH